MCEREIERERECVCVCVCVCECECDLVCACECVCVLLGACSFHGIQGHNRYKGTTHPSTQGTIAQRLAVQMPQL